MAADETHRAIEAVFRIERARLIAGLARMVRDVDRAEELAQEALLIALAEWPKSGVPGNPGAWLMAAAKRRAIDGIRHERMRERKHAEIARELDDERDQSVEELEAAMDGDLARSARRADAAADRRTDHRGDRARIPLHRADRRAAHRACQEDDRRHRACLRGPARRRAGGSARLGARGDLSHLQRRLRGHS